MGAAALPDATAVQDVLALRELVMHFGRVRAVDGVSLSIPRGNVVALVGESGSGKSTVGRCVVRLLEPTAGSIELHGVDITHLSRRRLRTHRREVAIVFQDPAGSLDPRLTVRSIVGEPLRLLRIARQTSARDEAVDAALGKVGLRPDLGSRFPHELSGGQRQRVSIARALISSPSLLIADEPTSALDVSVQASVLNLIADLQRDMGFACLFITHNLPAVEYLADEVAVMYLGRLVEHGRKDRIFDDPMHPYTRALLSAAPLPDPARQRARERIVLGGDIPSAVDPPSGCRFRTRCPIAISLCAEVVPPLRTLAGREVACHRAEEVSSRL